MKYFFVWICCFCNLLTNAQIIKGQVLDAQSGKPVEAASVFFDNTTTATETDATGNFQITIPANNKNQLVVSAFAYEYFIVSNPTATTNLKIRLKPEETILDELVIDKNVFTRKQMLKAFRHFFIGNTKNAKRTKILNENDLVFYFDTKTNQFTAHSDKPIVISNENLGYTINFHLQNFLVQYNFQTLEPANYVNSFYLGYSQFKELSQPRDKIIRNREETYKNSSAAFFKELLSNDLQSENFILAVNGFKVEPSEYFKKDTLGATATLCLVKKPVRKTPVIDKKAFANGVIKVDAVKEYKETEVPFNILNMKTKEQSIMHFQKNCIEISHSGLLLTPSDVLFGGFFGDLKTADMLPSGFYVEEEFVKPKKEKNILEDNDYIAFENEVVALYGTNEYIEYSSIKKQFKDLLVINEQEITTKNFQEWVALNLQKTKFETSKQAIDLYQKRNKLAGKFKAKEMYFSEKEAYFKTQYGDQFNNVFYKNVVSKVLKQGFKKP